MEDHAPGGDGELHTEPPYRPPDVGVTLDLAAHEPGGESGVAITLTVGHAARLSAMQVCLVRLDQHEVPAGALVSGTVMGSVSALLLGIDETLITAETLIEHEVIPAHTQRDCSRTQLLPEDAGSVPAGALETSWLIRVSLGRSHAPDVHRGERCRGR
jgi:hypothetical protein